MDTDKYTACLSVLEVHFETIIFPNLFETVGLCNSVVIGNSSYQCIHLLDNCYRSHAKKDG